MRKLLVVVLLAVGLVPVAGGTAWACSCGGAESEEAHYRAMARDAAAVYAGTVLDRVEDPPPPPAPPGSPPRPDNREVRYRIRVDRALKAAAEGEVRTLSTPRDDGRCGRQLTPGRVFMPEEPGRRFSSCSGVDQHDVDREVERYLRYNGGPSLPRTGGLPAAALALALAGLAGAAGAAGRRAAKEPG